MKIKHFTAPDMTTALANIKEELGKEAIIVATETISDGVKVTAAIEDHQNIDFDNHEKLEISPSLQVYDDVKLRESLEYHDILPEISGQILAIARQYYAQEKQGDNHKLLSYALQKMYKFIPILDSGNKNKVFLGMPGCGKSTSIAKIATKAKLQKKRTCIISTDNVRAGANQQLEAFSEILETDFYFCKNAKELFKTTKQGQERYDLLLIDTPGINPYVAKEVRRVEELLEGIKADRILVTDVGRNTLEAVETGEIFTSLDSEYLLPTHLDMTRRIGSVISSAYSNHLSFCAASVSSDIAKGMARVTASSLAKVLLTE